jgi:hypothetical protein
MEEVGPGIAETRLLPAVAVSLGVVGAAAGLDLLVVVCVL